MKTILKNKQITKFYKCKLLVNLDGTFNAGTYIESAVFGQKFTKAPKVKDLV
jgi:hypothetical protein